MYQVTNAYAIRSDLKALGGKFDGAAKAWIITDEAFAQLAARTHAFGMGWMQAWAGATKTRIGERAAPATSYRPAVTAPCRRCGSYCFGDCQG